MFAQDGGEDPRQLPAAGPRDVGRGGGHLPVLAAGGGPDQSTGSLQADGETPVNTIVWKLPTLI